MNPRLRIDNWITAGLIAASWVALIASDGLSRGTFVFGAFLGFLASMITGLAALSSFANKKLAFTKIQLISAAYVIAYSVCFLARSWTLGWVPIVSGIAIGVVIFSVLTISRWLGWLR